MENVYQPELWRDAYVMLGTAAAALIGLLFVVTSLHLEEIVNNPAYRIRARNNMFYLMVLSSKRRSFSFHNQWPSSAQN